MSHCSYTEFEEGGQRMRNSPAVQDNSLISGEKLKGNLIKKDAKNMCRTECAVARLAINLNSIKSEIAPKGFGFWPFD